MRSLRVLAIAFLVVIFAVQPTLAADPNGNSAESPSFNSSEAWAAELAADSIRPPNEPTILGSFDISASVPNPWGIGYNDRTGNVWVADGVNDVVTELTNTGAATGKSWSKTLWADMEYDSGRNLMYQVDADLKYNIRSWNPKTGTVGLSINDPKKGQTTDKGQTWSRAETRAVAYEPDYDTLYVGTLDGYLYRIAGLSHTQPGKILDHVYIPGLGPGGAGVTGGLAWLGNNKLAIVCDYVNPADNKIWIADGTTLEPLYDFMMPGDGSDGSAGIDCAADGTGWLINQTGKRLFHVKFDPLVITNAPAGTVEAGAAITVAWDAVPQAAYFKLKMSTDGGATWKPAGEGAGNITDTSYVWTVPPMAGQGSVECKLKLQAFKSNGELLAKRVIEPFTLKTWAITSPNGGETLTAGSTSTVQWEIAGDTLKAPVAKAKLFITMNMGTTWTLVSVTPNPAVNEVSFTVPTPAQDKLNKCKVKVVLVDQLGNQYVDKSDGWFSISLEP